MTIVLLVAVAVVAAIGVVGAARRGLSDERSSVREYQQTLDTLRHLSDRRAPPPRRGVPAFSDQVPPGVDVGDEAGPARTSPTAAASSSPAPSPPLRAPSRSSLWGRAGSPPTMVGVETPSRPPPQEREAATAGRPVRSGDVNAGPLTRSARPSPAASAGDAVRRLAAARATFGSRPTRPALPASTRRRDRRPLTATAAAVVVVGTLTGVAVALHPPARPGSSSPGVQHQAAPAAHKSKPAATGHPAGAANTAPSRVTTGLVPVTASTTEATYDVAGSPFSVSLAATGPCWVEAVDTSSGQVLWEGTLEAGSTQTFPTTAGLFLRLGNAPDVTVTEGGQRVQLPAGYNIVFDLTFVATSA